MKKLTALLLFVALLISGAVLFTPSIYATSNVFKDDVEVNLNIFFDEVNQTSLNVTKKEGDIISIGDLGNTTDHNFEFWIVNGVIRHDLSASSTFLATSQLEIIGVYSSLNLKPVIFMDSNGKLIGSVKYVSDGQSVTPPNMSWNNYTKPGYNLVMSGEQPAWKRLVGNNTFNNITQATVFTLNYVVADENRVVTINQVDYPYDSLQTISSTNSAFTHWADPSGRVISYRKNLEVSALYNRTIIEKTTPVTVKPVVYMLDVTGIRTDYQSYLGQYELPNGYEAVSFGFKVGDSLIKSNSVHKTSNEFLRSIPNNNDKVVRAYLTYKNSNNEIVTIYSDSYTDPGKLNVTWNVIEPGSAATYELYTENLVNKGFELDSEVFAYQPKDNNTWNNRLEAWDDDIRNYDYIIFDMVIDKAVNKDANFWMDMNQVIFMYSNGSANSLSVEKFDMENNKVLDAIEVDKKYTFVVKLEHTHLEPRYAFGFGNETLTAYISNIAAISSKTYKEIFEVILPETHQLNWGLTGDNNGSTYVFDNNENAYKYISIAGAWANRLQTNDPMLPNYDYIVFDFKLNENLAGDIQFWMDMNPNNENVFTFMGENNNGRAKFIESTKNEGYNTMIIKLGHGHPEGWYAMGFFGSEDIYIKDLYAAKQSHVNMLLGIDTSNMLVYEGTSDYTIVYPYDADPMVKTTAVNELKYFFNEATGVKLDAVSDAGLVIDQKNKYISIGDTGLLRQSNLKNQNIDLGNSGVRVVTQDQNIFLFGDTQFGDLFAVYEFLEKQLNFEMYAVDEFYIERDITNLERMEFDITYIPSFEFRVGSYGELWYGHEFTRRMRMHRNDDVWMGLPTKTNNLTYKENYHNFDAVKNAHNYNSDWYSNDQLRLYTFAEEISDGILELMKVEIEANPHLSVITFTQNDYNKWSNDYNSNTLKNEFGTNAAEMIMFLNLLATKVQNWLDVAHPNREVMILMFAYQQTELAPVRVVNGEYVPFDERVVLVPNAGVIYAPIFAEHYYGYDAPQNSDIAETMKKWAALTDNIFMWSYGTYFPNYFMPYDNFKSIQNKYQFTINNGGGMYMFDQGQFNQNIGTDWFRLKEYLISKLQWNADLDMETLIDNFFDNYFKDSSSSMKSFFNSQQLHHTWLAEENGITGYVSAGSGPKNMQDMRKKEYWPEAELEEWQGYINQALLDIEHLSATNNELYEILKYRIDLEAMSIMYLKYQLYGKVSKSTFIAEANRLGIERFSEQYGINENWK